MFAFSIISQHWDGTGSENPSPWKTSHLSYNYPTNFNVIAADDLAMQRARATAAMIWTLLTLGPEYFGFSPRGRVNTSHISKNTDSTIARKCMSCGQQEISKIIIAASQYLCSPIWFLWLRLECQHDGCWWFGTRTSAAINMMTQPGQHQSKIRATSNEASWVMVPVNNFLLTTHIIIFLHI